MVNLSYVNKVHAYTYMNYLCCKYFGSICLHNNRNYSQKSRKHSYDFFKLDYIPFSKCFCLRIYSIYRLSHIIYIKEKTN